MFSFYSYHERFRIIVDTTSVLARHENPAGHGSVPACLECSRRYPSRSAQGPPLRLSRLRSISLRSRRAGLRPCHLERFFQYNSLSIIVLSFLFLYGIGELEKGSALDSYWFPPKVKPPFSFDFSALWIIWPTIPRNIVTS
jgi:hypothetical protein